jgi:3'(2'), 5'-bisphosphate nucleotidase
LIALKSEYWTAIKASIEASEKIMEIYENGFETEFKNDGSPVTQADLASSAIIDEYLSTTGIPVTGEETFKTPYEERQNWIESWCIDPLDGTKEFVKKNGEFAVNIALIRNERPVFGLIASPVEQKLIFGGHETGVYITDFYHAFDPEKWTKLTEPKSVNSPLMVTCSRSHHSGPVLQYLNQLKETHESLDFIKKGSSLKFFDLATGRADAYPRFAPTMEWDIAAGQAILEALGGSVVHAHTQEALSYNKDNLTNPYFIARTKALIEHHS